LDQSKATQAIPILELLSVEGLDTRDTADTSLLRARAEYLLNRENGRGYGEAVAKALRAARAYKDEKTLIGALFECARAGAELGMEETLLSARTEIQGLLIDPTYGRLHETHYALAFCEAALNRAPSAQVQIAKSIELLGNSGDSTQLSRLYTGLGAVSHMLCELSEACAAFFRALQMAQEIGDDSRASTIAANICTSLTLLGRYDEAMSMGNYAIETGRKVLNQPLFVSAYTNMVDAYVLTGHSDQAQNCLAAAKDWLRHERSWFARVTLLLEEASYSLMMGDRSGFMDVAENIEREAHGRENYFFRRGTVAKYLAYKAALDGREIEALEKVTLLSSQFRNDCPMAYLDTLAARVYLEKLVTGRSDAESDLLSMLDVRGMHGKRAMLEREGFISRSQSCLADPTA
jgi:tetratricopeptide (TPR) repeat protein